MPEVVLFAPVRTPIGKYLGGLAELTAPQPGCDRFARIPPPREGLWSASMR